MRLCLRRGNPERRETGEAWPSAPHGAPVQVRSGALKAHSLPEGKPGGPKEFRLLYGGENAQPELRV